MQTKIISLASEKGGTGKSTISVNLSVTLAKNYRVALVDCDPQRSSLDFALFRRDNRTAYSPIEIIELNQNTTDSVQRSLHELKTSGDFDYIVVDTAGQDCIETRSVLQIADLAISPTRPQYASYATLGSFVNVLNDCLMLNQNLKAFVILNEVNNNDKGASLQRAKDYLLEIDSLTLMKSSLYQRKIYSQSFELGVSVKEYNDHHALFKKEDKSITDKNILAEKEFDSFIEELMEAL